MSASPSDPIRTELHRPTSPAWSRIVTEDESRPADGPGVHSERVGPAVTWGSTLPIGPVTPLIAGRPGVPFAFGTTKERTSGTAARTMQTRLLRDVAPRWEPVQAPPPHGSMGSATGCRV